MRINYFDSCVYPVKNNLEEIKKLKNKFIKKNYFALIHIMNDLNLTKYNYVLNNLNFFFPLLHISKKKNIKNQLSLIKKNKIKFVKIHPRFLNKKLDKYFNFYKKIFLFCEKNSISIFYCTFSSWENEVYETNQLELLAKLSNILKKSKLILMHGGGCEILKYYEKFRFKKNVFLDLSYTIQHFKKTTLINDILFCINNFDRRIILGSDYPSKSIKDYFEAVRFLKKKIKIKKFKNIIFNNLNELIKSGYKKKNK